MRQRNIPRRRGMNCLQENRIGARSDPGFLRSSSRYRKAVMRKWNDTNTPSQPWWGRKS